MGVREKGREDGRKGGRERQQIQRDGVRLHRELGGVVGMPSLCTDITSIDWANVVSSSGGKPSEPSFTTGWGRLGG